MCFQLDVEGRVREAVLEEILQEQISEPATGNSSSLAVANLERSLPAPRPTLEY